MLGVDYTNPDDRAKYPDTFITRKNLDKKNPFDVMVIVLYFSFTTLSTVGFGDFVPRTNDERIVGIFILVFGVAIFSIIMGSFVEILQKFKSLNEEFSDERLSSFFEIMRHFNNNQLIDQQLKTDIEKHFEYKWVQDRNQPFNDEIGSHFMMQLSADTEHRILRDYMFMDFLAAFKELFDLEKFKSDKEYIRYQWSDDIYAKFMNQLIRMLEPRREEKNVILINENEEWSEVFFFVIGSFTIGFEINKRQYYVLRYNNTNVGTEPISFQHRQVIGALGVTFNKRAKFSYKTLTTCEGYTIRKKNWKVLFKENPEMG